MSKPSRQWTRAARLADLKAGGCAVLNLEGRAAALFHTGERIHAVDNRCPHMGFPLHRGTVQEGILTCHWHHARFDLASGGTFDPWADELQAFPVEIRDGEVWVDLTPRADPCAHHRLRMRDGLEQNLSLVIAKSVLGLLEGCADPVDAFRIGLEFGARYRRAGWGSGLTIHTAMMNLLAILDPQDRPRAMYHGLSAVAADCAGMAPRFGVRPLPANATEPAVLKAWFRRFIEVRDSEGAERCLVSAVRSLADARQVADMLFAAATDHRLLQIGHVLDFINKAMEALDHAGWEFAEPALASLVPGLASADRMEESNAWRHPVNLVSILEAAFEALPAAFEQGLMRRQTKREGAEGLLQVLLGDEAASIAGALLEALKEGSSAQDLASTVAYAAALRIARFPTTNEFGDWDSALHTFTFANAVHQGLRRVSSPELVRGVFDAAMSVYLDRFLNVPAVRLPEPDGKAASPESMLEELPALLDRQQQVNEAGELVARFLFAGGDPDGLRALLGRLLLREDRDFHTIQMCEAAFRQFESRRGTAAGAHVLIAAARYLAAHAPTARAQGQTYLTACRLHRGERVFEEG